MRRSSLRSQCIDLIVNSYPSKYSPRLRIQLYIQSLRHKWHWFTVGSAIHDLGNRRRVPSVYVGGDWRMILICLSASEDHGTRKKRHCDARFWGTRIYTNTWKTGLDSELHNHVLGARNSYETTARLSQYCSESRVERIEMEFPYKGVRKECCTQVSRWKMQSDRSRQAQTCPVLEGAPLASPEFILITTNPKFGIFSANDFPQDTFDADRRQSHVLPPPQ